MGLYDHKMVLLWTGLVIDLAMRGADHILAMGWPERGLFWQMTGMNLGWSWCGLAWPWSGVIVCAFHRPGQSLAVQGRGRAAHLRASKNFINYFVGL
jgi:hypothetical protein